MSGIYVQKLNPKLKQNIADKVYTISEMAQIRKKVETQIATTQKGVRRAAITLLVIAVVHFMYDGRSDRNRYDLPGIRRRDSLYRNHRAGRSMGCRHWSDKISV